jgi:hypothetical protein
MNRNWRNRYHKELDSPQLNEDHSEPSDSEPEELGPPSVLPVNPNPRSRRFSIWISAVCYTFALSILIAISLDWATTTVDENRQPTSDCPINLTETYEPSADFEFREFSPPDLEENLQQIIEDPARGSLFRERLNSLYLVILGAVAGYLQAIQRVNTR